jgi:tape measure domain-containing protein
MAETNIGGIYYDLDLNDSNFKSKVSGASKQMQGLQGAFSSAENGSKQLATGLLGMATSITAGGLFALKSAGDVEMLRTSLDTMTGSTKAGEKVFKDLYDFAAKTPFETTELAKATQTMLGFGITTDKVMPYLRMLGDVSMGNKDKLQGLSLAFAQVQSTGRLMGQDLLQMINNGFNPLTVIAQKTGKSMADLKDEMSAGEISAEMVADAFKTATEKGGLFYQGMDKGSKTLQGIWSTLMDNIGMLTRSLVGLSETGEVVKGGLLDKVKTGIETLTTTIQNNIPNILNTVQSFLDLIINNFPIIAGMIMGGLVPAFVALAASLWATYAPLIPFIVAGALVGLAIKALIEHMGGMEQATKKVKEIFDVLVWVFNTYLKPSLDMLWNSISQNLLPALKRLWDVISPVLIPILKVLATILAGALVIAINVVANTLSVVINIISGVVSAISWLLNSIGNIYHSIVNAMRGVKDALTQPFREAFDWIRSSVDSITNKLKDLSPFTRHSPSLVDQVTKGVEIIKRQYDSLGQISLPQVTLPEMATVGVGAGVGGQNIQIYIDKVSDYQDVQAIGRELAFRAGLQPA